MSETFHDDACPKELIFSKLLLVVANLCNLNFLQKVENTRNLQFFANTFCVYGFDQFIVPIKLQFGCYKIYNNFTTQH